MAVKARFVPDRKQGIAAIKDVVYEYANLMAAAYYSIHGQAPWRTNCDDAFLLGCRKLGDFLMKDKRSKNRGQELDDILALDYLPTNAKTRKWKLPIWTAQWREPMNKYLAHMAYSRTYPPVQHWDHRIWVPQLETEFNSAWWGFREAITDKDYSAEFDNQNGLCQAKEGFENIVLQRR